MSSLIAIGETLVSLEELEIKAAEGHIKELRAKAMSDPGYSVAFRGGMVKACAFQPGISPGGITPFTPIGLGKPLTLRIEHIYTGKIPSLWLGLVNPDLLLSSAYKSGDVFTAAPRAVNWLANGKEKEVEKMKDYNAIPAISRGTSLVYYSPAITDDELNLMIEMVSDSFPQEVFDQVSQLLGTAGNLPVFAIGRPDVSLALLAASTVVKIIGALGEALADGKAFMKDSLPINFNRPGLGDAQAGKVVFASSQYQRVLENTCFIQTGECRLSYKANNRAYDGDIPYVVVSLDGAENPKYKDFKHTLATAEELNRFYHANSGQMILNGICEGVTLYNDLEYRKKADEQKRIMDKIADPNSDEYKKAKTLYEAYIKNVINDVFKPQ